MSFFKEDIYHRVCVIIQYVPVVLDPSCLSNMHISKKKQAANRTAHIWWQKQDGKGFKIKVKLKKKSGQICSRRTQISKDNWRTLNRNMTWMPRRDNIKLNHVQNWNWSETLWILPLLVSVKWLCPEKALRNRNPEKKKRKAHRECAVCGVSFSSDKDVHDGKTHLWHRKTETNTPSTCI